MANIKTRPVIVEYDITLTQREADALTALLGATAGSSLDDLYDGLLKSGVTGINHAITTDTNAGSEPVVRIEPKTPAPSAPAPSTEPRVAVWGNETEEVSE